MSDTQQRINTYTNRLEIIRGNVVNLLMPVRYFKALNIIPATLFDGDIINTNFDVKWVFKTYYETYSCRHIKDRYFGGRHVDDDYNYGTI